MASSLNYKVMLRERFQHGPAFHKTLLTEVVVGLQSNDVKAGKWLARDHPNATMGFGEVGGLTGKFMLICGANLAL